MSCIFFRIRSKRNKKFCYCAYHKREVIFAECRTCEYKQHKQIKPIKARAKTYKRYSIITDDLDTCFLCGKRSGIEKHEIMFGTANRKLSIKYGLVVGLCHNCHNEPPLGVHHNYFTDLKLKQIAQKRFEEEYPNESFTEMFGENFLNLEGEARNGKT